MCQVISVAKSDSVGLLDTPSMVLNVSGQGWGVVAHVRSLIHTLSCDPLTFGVYSVVDSELNVMKQNY